MNKDFSTIPTKQAQKVINALKDGKINSKEAKQLGLTSEETEALNEAFSCGRVVIGDSLLTNKGKSKDGKMQYFNIRKATDEEKRIDGNLPIKEYWTKVWVETDENGNDINKSAIVTEDDKYIIKGDLTAADKINAGIAKPEVIISKTINILAKRQNEAIGAYKKQAGEDGWTGRVADIVASIFGSKNTSDDIKSDIHKNKLQLEALKNAQKKGSNAFRAKYKELFNVIYNPVNIVAYQRAEQEYINASVQKAAVENFEKMFSVLLRDGKLNEEYTTMSSPSIGAPVRTKTANKNQVYARDFKNLASVMGGEDVLNDVINNSVGRNASIEKKYEVMHNIAVNLNKGVQSNLKKTLNGKSYEEVQKSYEKNYQAAFGRNNDIIKRITDYNISQQKGSGWVKTVAAAGLMIGATALAVPTGGASMGGATTVLTGMGIAAATSAAVNLTDEITKPRVQQAFKKGFSNGLDEMDFKNIVAASLTSAAFVGAASGVGRAVQILTVSMKPAAQIAAMFGADVALGISSEYVLTGKVSIEGIVFTVAISATGTILAMKAAKNQESKLRAELVNARKTLGIADKVELSDKLLKSAYRSAAKAAHPDKGGSAAAFQKVQSAYNLLKAQKSTRLTRTRYKESSFDRHKRYVDEYADGTEQLIIDGELEFTKGHNIDGSYYHRFPNGEVRTFDTEGNMILKGDGQITSKINNEDGSYELLFENGSSKKFDSYGRLMGGTNSRGISYTRVYCNEYHYRDNYANGITYKYDFDSDYTPDISKIKVFKNGLRVCILYRDGSKLIDDKDGKGYTKIYSDGSKEHSYYYHWTAKDEAEYNKRREAEREAESKRKAAEEAAERESKRGKFGLSSRYNWGNLGGYSAAARN